MVDDSQLVLAMTKAALERVGVVVVTLISPIGFTKVLDERPDLALIDVGMPALRGDQLAEMIRASLARLPVRWSYFLSARKKSWLA